ncbi:MAG: ClbS/DfsB family four-helix bundle protein [Chloroflexi bacterium]|nr:ClbS/DfsB family four-helix bundle protein [Ardenticatenaceae bacterium]NOG37576.1 ClbS/DfsB family four-helix bundle protein [Chloroflexota bacterium]
MNKFELLGEMTKANDEMEMFLAALTEAEMADPGPGGDWSAKDTLAHITAWMKLAAGWLEKTINGEPVTRYQPGYELTGDEAADEAIMDRLNDHIFETYKDMPAAAIIAEYRQACEELTTVVATMIEEDLLEPGRMAWYPDQPVWLNIAGNSFWHIRDHLAAFQESTALTD